MDTRDLSLADPAGTHGVRATDAAGSAGLSPPHHSPPASSPASSAHREFERLLGLADIRVLRTDQRAQARPWDILLRPEGEGLAARVKRDGLVGLGDAFIDGWWDCESKDELFFRAFRADLPSRLKNHPRVWLDYLTAKFRDLQHRSLARRNVEVHYDLGNELFQAMLDPWMQYTCGYWKTARTLDQAQVDKLDLICRKLALRPGMTLLDMGCGWGGLARFAAERYGVKVTAVTLSPAQVAYAKETCRGLEIEFRLQDYRDVRGTFDRVTSIGMFEHVGPRHHRGAMKIVRECLADDGLALIHFIATRDSFPNREHSEVGWINKHIFPGAVLPSLAQIGTAIDGQLVLEDLHNFGADYDRTLMAWAANFRRHWPDLKAKYDERFFRMWTYYLDSCAGAFRARNYQLWQLVLSKRGLVGGYESIRETKA